MREPYRALAEQALQHYGLGETDLTFVQHNAGVVYQVHTPDMGRRYLLKIHARIGSGGNPSTAELDAGMRWLSGVAQATDLVVPTPVATADGRLVCQVTLPNGPPICCTLQEWVEGEPPHGDFSESQARQLGSVLAKLHAFSRQTGAPTSLAAGHQDSAALAESVHTLRTALDETVLPPDAFALVVAAQTRIGALMQELGTGSGVWGPVHGDLHYDNVLIYQDEIRPIDFTGLRLAHYLYDLGVTLYHTYYQGDEIRRALLEGYRQFYTLPDEYPRLLEAFVTHAALDNLAWNSTIPDQVSSQPFRRNLQQLIDPFCAAVAEDRSFLFV